MIIKFLNWEKYNPPSNKTNSWFRLNSNIISRPVWDELTNDDFRIFIYLLCQANDSNNRGITVVSTRGVSARCSVSEKDVYRTIKILKKFQVIEVRAPSGRFANSASILPTNDTNDTNDTNELKLLSDSPSVEPRRFFDFESLYKKYPRKEGKQKGLLTCKSQIKTEDDFSLLSKAIDSYITHCSKNATDPKYIKMFSTFMSSWRDWLDPQTGTSVNLSESKKAMDRAALMEKLK